MAYVCSEAVVSDPWLQTASPDLRDETENGQIIWMFGNDHFQNSWWGNYCVSSRSLPLMFPLALLCPLPPPHLCEAFVRHSLDLNSL